MRYVPLFLSLLAVSRNKSMKWFIDGNNLMGHRGTPKTREAIVEKLQPMREQGLDVVIVFDRRKSESAETQIAQEGLFSTVIVGDGTTADDYILERIEALKESKIIVQVVTADRELRCKALASRYVVRKVINPVVFWRRYRPRLSGLKKADLDVKEN